MDPALSSGSLSRFAPVLGRAQTVLIHSFEWLLYACVALYGFAPQIAAADFGWHLAQADWMLRHGAFLRQDLFNYPNLYAPLINEYPFYQVVIWLAWRFGETGAATLCAGLLVLLYAMYFQAGRRLHFPTALLGASLFLSVVLSLGRFTLRPELATSLGSVFFLTFLLRHRGTRDWKRFWPLVLGQVLWVNSHSGFILGPALVVGFGVEMTLRAAWQERRFPRAVAAQWTTVGALVVLACFLTPYGPARLWLPFYHQGNELIRAYVTEMQPLSFNPLDFTVIVMLLQLALIALTCLRFRGGLSWSFLLLTLVFFQATFISERHVSVFTLLAPGVLLSAIVFEPRARRNSTPAKAAGTSPVRPFLIALLLVLGVLLLLNEELRPTSNLSPIARWRDWNQRQTELPINAVEWMKQRQLNGRLFHRSEFGGWLQYVGYNQGQTYCDTGFGKYAEAMIHEIGLASEEPASLPVLLRRYRPDITIVANMAYNWPYYLRQEGWRCVFYAPDGSVWLPPGAHPELPAVTSEEVAQRFVRNHEQNGFPARAFLFYRQLLTLHSMGMGCDKLAFEQLMQLPEFWQSKFLFWEVARKMTIAPPFLSREPLAMLYQLAEKPENRPASLHFRATVHARRGEWKEVVTLLDILPRHSANDTGFTLLAEGLLETGRVDEAATLLREDAVFAIANVHRYELLARVEAQLGHAEAAAKARERAKFFAPLQP